MPKNHMPQAYPYDNHVPRYLPHLHHPKVLQMGLRPLSTARWIEPDNHWLHYHRHKLQQRESLGDSVYRALPNSLAAQQELRDLLRDHLITQHSALYRDEGDHLVYLPEQTRLSPLSKEPLWDCSLWIADDLLLMQEVDGQYRLSAASLATPSAWLLEEKFGESLTAIHAPIPGFDAALGPKVARFFRKLKVQQPVERYNWSLQVGEALSQRGKQQADSSSTPYDASAPLFYRCERQTLRRLPNSGAVAFTIRVYVHPLDTLLDLGDAANALFAAIDATSPEIARYKGFDRIAPALAKYRER